MRLTTNNKNLIYSFLLVETWTAFILLISYPDTQGLGDFFSASIFYILTLYVALGLGIIALSLRFLRIIKNNSNFFYSLTGVLNLSIGILAVILIYFKDITEEKFIRLFLLSLFYGLIIIIDIVFIKSLSSKSL